MARTAAPLEPVDICVVGAGPSGLSAAVMFAREGFSTALVAPVGGPSDGRTTALLQASIDLLDRLDVWNELAVKTAPLARMRMIDDTGRLMRAPEVTFESGELDLEAFGYNIKNQDLTAALSASADTLPNLSVIEEKASNAHLGPDKAVIETETGRQIEADLIVAADGRKSMLREAAGIGVRKWSYPQVAVVLNLEHDRPHADVSTEFHTPTGPFTLVPLPGRCSSLVCVETAEGAESLLAMNDDDLALELERRAHSILGQFKIATKPQTFPLSGMNAKNLAANRVALVGETAHVFPPIGAQGLNLSLRDVAVLGDIVAKARASAADIGGAQTLSSYESKRRTDIVTRTGAVDLLNRSLLSDFLPLQIARSTGLYLADKIGPLRRLLMREGMAPGTRQRNRRSLPKSPRLLRPSEN
ncbi:2-octaprenyl-3-methyl-6-methoxy-1,4-benzoquinol hydroxylase [Roseibium hamelinense]|uniref:2-octaprenyl-3-methyl-6-methoxy-1,4-benzoquinol hydroxylase n=1 Tax=Roseibium hamelinense TaxID=150831 RepID=A0A562THA6_9HYPH|nr:UbiH/UbiF family hydroxylase [Roseibium hamelinense]MTI45806.1 UbiH/UbiF family hydroxylase [Roseibium hamelinense]TWI93011.1 2-octaprenyl-3-methyl-6-methoxy-1,4-benzoquinol hydroxylase [Roseibium hamelinense]